MTKDPLKTTWRTVEEGRLPEGQFIVYTDGPIIARIKYGGSLSWSDAERATQLIAAAPTLLEVMTDIWRIAAGEPNWAEFQDKIRAMAADAINKAEGPQ